mmetsp:Transcript_121184/g.388154  ORF Transcript_121184/g.388154 Transcript_121184/m.388154 type:complete len:235 (+) Transcript_121184:200-904(+)
MCGFASLILTKAASPLLSSAACAAFCITNARLRCSLKEMAVRAAVERESSFKSASAMSRVATRPRMPLGDPIATAETFPPRAEIHAERRAQAAASSSVAAGAAPSIGLTAVARREVRCAHCGRLFDATSPPNPATASAAPTAAAVQWPAARPEAVEGAADGGMPTMAPAPGAARAPLLEAAEAPPLRWAPPAKAAAEAAALPTVVPATTTATAAAEATAMVCGDLIASSGLQQV